jgi:pilus assembly protein CpaE
VPTAELQKILQVLADELADSKRHATGSIQVFMNGKGGAGASFLATNVAHGLATAGQSVALIDLDLQFAGLCRYLDLEPTRGLFEALDAVEDLDEVSAQAFTCEHHSGLRLLSAKCDRLRLNVDVSPERLAALLQAYRRFNDFVIVDVPRNIDLLNAAALEAADNITVVLQQSLPHLHDTARLLEVLRSEIGVDDSRLSVVVNRYVKDAVISTKDIEKALRVSSVTTIPNQYKLVAESIDSGIPLAETARNAAVARGLRTLQQQIGGVAEEETGLLGRALPGFLRR